MKGRQFFFGVMVWAMGFVGVVQGQSFYTLMDDASGFNLSTYLPGLNEKACEIRNIFPDPGIQE